MPKLLLIMESSCTFKTAVAALFFLLLQTNFVKSQSFHRIDFEAGGFVLAQVPTPDGSTIYARTDVGGIYKKIGNDEWKFISEFATTPAALM
ncbi:MAG TPA: hypothetical protein VG961_04525, partial [Ignavibacteria bacterium]|nr:hypothetical protein [Ignavibacteria bacterium]